MRTALSERAAPTRLRPEAAGRTLGLVITADLPLMAEQRSSIERELATLDRTLTRQARQARSRTLRAMRETLRDARPHERPQRARSMRISWARLPRDDSGGGGGTMRRVHLDRAPGRGTHTIHFALSQSHSPAESKRRQRYIERDGACAASFGNIGDTEEERDRLWGQLSNFGVSRSGRIELGPGTAPNVKRLVLTRLLGSDDALPGGMEPSRIQYLSELDDEELDRRKISFRTHDPDTHTQWLEHIARAIADADTTPDLPGNRSLLDPTQTGPEDTAPLAPGVRIKGGRDAVVIVANNTPAEALKALATLVEGETEHLIDPASAATLAAWREGRAAGQDIIIRADRTDVVDYLAKESSKLGELAEDNEHIKVGSRPGTELILAKGAPPVIKRLAVQWWQAHHPHMAPTPGESGKRRFAQLVDAPLARLDDEHLAFRVTGKEQKALRDYIEHASADITRGRFSEDELRSRHEPPVEKVKAKPGGVRDWQPRVPIVQRQIILELAHELSSPQREKALKSWCEKNLKGLAWHAVIHRPEEKNDARNWHAHIVYSNVAVERRKDGPGWTFEEPDARRPEPNETIRCLSGNGPLKGTGRNRLIQQWRQDICELQNQYLAEIGAEKRYDHRSYASMGVDREPGEHLGPGRFRRDLEGDTRATGAPSPYWRDVETTLRARLRVEGASSEARDLACDVLELSRLLTGIPDDDATTKNKLDAERRRARQELGELLSAEAALLADELIGQHTALPTLPPVERKEPWRTEHEALAGIGDAWIHGARAERLFERTATDPKFTRALREDDPQAVELQATARSYQEATRQMRLDAAAALRGRRARPRDRAAVAVHASAQRLGFTRPEQYLGQTLGTELDQALAREQRAAGLDRDIRVWARVCHGGDKGIEVQRATALLLETGRAAFADRPELEKRIAGVGRRSARAADLRAEWNACTTEAAIKRLAHRRRGRIATLTAWERRGFRAGTQPKAVTEEDRNRLATLCERDDAEAAQTLRAIDLREHRRLAALAPKVARKIQERLRELRVQKDALTASLRTAESPDAILAAEAAHPAAASRAVEPAPAFEAAWAAAGPARKALAKTALRLPGDDALTAAWTATRGLHPGRKAILFSAHPGLGPLASEGAHRAAEERAHARAALRGAPGADDETLADIRAAPDKLRWLDEETRAAIERHVPRPGRPGLDLDR